jgi:primosomal protein N' (replication factor Y)
MTLVLNVALPYPLAKGLDYLPPEGVDATRMRPGLRVEVPLGKRRVVGYLLAVGESEAVDPARLKRAFAALDESSLLSADDIAVLLWASRYYHHPVGEVFAAAFPVLLRRGLPASIESERRLCLGAAGREAEAPKRAPRQAQLLQWLSERENGGGLAELAALDWDWDWRAPARALLDKGWIEWREYAPGPAATSPPRAVAAPALNEAQAQAWQAMTAALGDYRAFLLEGVTGSGKTEVYLRFVEQVLARGAQALVLLPEINLTPQLEARFRQRFAAPLAVFHSGLGEGERRRAWLAMQSGTASILLGTRSAVFAPLARPGAIILDEEHDASFKQQEGFRFSARDVAVMRARQMRVPIVLGTATPSLESLHNAARGRYVRLALPERAGGAAHPEFRVIDIRDQPLNEGLSQSLIARIAAVLERREQSLLFLNRRGFAPALICHACGWVAECGHCDAKLVLHAGEGRLRCHFCGHAQATPSACPVCRTADLRPLGLGTERVEQALGQLFPQARILRIDRDSTRRKGALENMLEQARSGGADILLGTQMLAKGHHFPEVTLAGILDVDAGFYSLDFRAAERTAQLIVQVAGRAGRERRAGKVVLQTRHPDHPLLRTLIREGYPAFAEAALEERRQAQLPPHSHQALWRADADDPGAPEALLSKLRELALAHHAREVRILGPVPAPMPRQAGRWRGQLLLQSARRNPLHELVDHLLRHLPKLPEARRARCSVDIDPADLY